MNIYYRAALMFFLMPNDTCEELDNYDDNNNAYEKFEDDSAEDDKNKITSTTNELSEASE